MRSEGGAAEVMVNRALGIREADSAAQESTTAVCGCARLTEGGPPLTAVRAVAAAWHEDHDDVIAELNAGDTLAERLDYSRCFMTEHHGDRPRPVSIDDGQVRVAETGGGDAHQHFASAGRR
jgi:hypothetical protein